MFCLCSLQILFLFSFGIQFSTSQIADTVEKIKTATGIHNVLVTHNETVFELSNHGESRTYFSLVVPDVGFEYVIENPFEVELDPDIVRMDPLGSVTFTSDDPLVGNQTLHFRRISNWGVMVYFWYFGKFPNQFGIPLMTMTEGEKPPMITSCTVFPNGTVWSFPLVYDSTPIYFPSLNNAPVYGTDRRIINLKLYWVDAIGPIRIKFPFSVSFLSNDNSTGTTTVPPSTTAYSEVTTTKKGLLNKKWWLIVVINAIIVMSNGVIIGVLIYKLLRFNVETESMASSATSSTAASDDIVMTETLHRGT